jgi:hypothetical protein
MRVADRRKELAQQLKLNQESHDLFSFKIWRFMELVGIYGFGIQLHFLALLLYQAVSAVARGQAICVAVSVGGSSCSGGSPVSATSAGAVLLSATGCGFSGCWLSLSAAASVRLGAVCVGFVADLAC